MTIEINQLVLVLVSLIFANIVGPIIAYKIGRKKSWGILHDRSLQNRYKLIYSPLRSLLLETHITGAGIGFTLCQRFKRSWLFLIKLRIKEGIKRFSKEFGRNDTWEVEFGDFPMGAIKSIVKKQSQWADYELMDLVQSAERASYETEYYAALEGTTECSNMIEPEKMKLVDHIWKMYSELNRKLFP